MKRIFANIGILLAFGAAGPTMLPAQDAGLILHSESRVVLVDAVAVDKKGKFVRDLTQKDFRIWEDGKEQKIGAFSLESSGVSPERPSKHYIALFFDTSNADQAGQMAARQEAIRFVEGFASADRYMAVINYNVNGGLRVTQNFTTDRDQLKRALSALPASSNSVATPSAAAAAAATRGGRGGVSGPAPPVDTFAYRDMLGAFRALIGSLGNVRGRKAVIFFGGGIAFSNEIASDVTATISAGNKANVAVYTVGSGAESGTAGIVNGGIIAQAGRNPRAAPDFSGPSGSADQSLSGSLAEGTGGIAFQTTTGLAASLGKVAQEQDEYYLLAYTPAIDSAEGSCHELRVKVDRGDLDVRARKSYCTSKPADLLSGKPAGQALEARAAGAAPGNIAASMQLPWFYSGPNVARVNLAMEIIPSAMKLQKDKGKLHGEFDLAGIAYKPDGSPAARISDTVKLDFNTQQEADTFLKTPYHYENQFEIAPGQYSFRMAFSSGAQGFGKTEMPLKIDPWDGKTLSLSGLALSRDAHPATDLAAGLDVSLLEGMRPLVARGTEVVPAGTNRFRSGEKVFLYVEVYEPMLTGADSGSLPQIGLRTRILDRATGQPRADSEGQVPANFMSAGNPVVPIASVLPIANLPAGAYILEVGVARQSGIPVVRTAEFDIN